MDDIKRGQVGQASVVDPSIIAGVTVGTTVTGPTDSAGPALAALDSPVKKVIVAVHGVGDQYLFATIQSVVAQFCSFYNEPAGVPLGNFHTATKTFSLKVPDDYPREPFERFAFAEVYWAKYPRTLVAEKYTLEESKKWAQTIVERLRLRWRRKGQAGGCEDRDFRLLKQVLGEMIQTVAVVDRICYFGERAGLFTFDLRRLLDDYLGDVQIVTEFGASRLQILQAFRELMADVHTSFPKAEIYIIAHSEGTVVTMLGLLEAFRDEEHTATWTHHVRGLMTLGSPIDKHLVLWPELFGDEAPRHTPKEPIVWHNYYDRGDPIGFALNDVRAWIALRGWREVFDFPPEHDHGFTRYPFPGKAHVDYWNDEAVFGHFIETVVKETPPASSDRATTGRRMPPADLHIQKWLSYTVPYLGIATLLFVAVYILFKAVVGAVGSVDAQSTSDILREVARYATLLFGVTVAARVPRLTRDWRVRAAALGIAMLTCVLYYLSEPGGGAAHPLGRGLELPAGTAMVALAVVVIALAYFAGSVFPLQGVTPLMSAGALVVAGIVIWHVVPEFSGMFGVKVVDPKDVGAVWPVFLATGAFLYLWWLAALLFDLVVIWHWYIRHAQMLTRMDAIAGGKRRGTDSEPTAPDLESRDHAPQVQV